MSKITRATFKSFLRKNQGNLFINIQSRFDGMTDMVESRNGGFVPATSADWHTDSNCGIQGACLVGGSRNLFSLYENNGFHGIEVYNCCGQFVVATKI